MTRTVRTIWISIAFILALLLACTPKVEKESGKKVDFSAFPVENRITSSIISNKILEIIDMNIASWAGDTAIVNSIRQSNTENAKRSQADIKKLDDTWKKGDQNLIDTYMGNSVSAFLKDIADKSKGLFSEIFIMDYQGCLTGLSHKTSDFWQGDEDKFQKSYNTGSGKVFIDSIELDESTQSRLVQVSLPITDPLTLKVIGAITVGIDINKI